MANVIDQIGRVIFSRRSTFIGIALSLGIGATLYLLTARAIEQDAEARFSSIARNTQSTLNGRIKGYADVLRGTASLFQTGNEITRQQFHSYVEGLQLDTEFPGIETVNFAKYVKDEELPAFEASMRKELASVPDAPAFKVLPPGRRRDYTILTFVEPSDIWTKRMGIDLQVRPAVASALADSRDTGRPSTSGTRIVLKTTVSGLAMRIPVYRPGMPVETVEQRRAAYFGSVGIGFGVLRLVNGVVDDLPQDMRLVITGMSPEEENFGPPGNYRRIIFFDNLAGKKAGSNDTFELTLPIGIKQRGWAASFSVPKSNLYSDIDSYLPWVACIVGMLSTLLLYALYQTLSKSRQRAMLLAAEMTRELRASEARLQQTNERLRRLAAHAENIKEGERKRIAREIHDDLGQNLLALRIEADLLASRTVHHHPRLHARAKWTLVQIDTTIKSVRQIINDLRPNVLDLGLAAAVDWQIMEFQRRTNVSCELIQTRDEIQVNDQCATALFRILQESLSNITRHAHASHVIVELGGTANRVSLSVTDNGVGIQSANHRSGSFGLVGIEERVRILGGSFELSNAPGGGTRVAVSIPADNPFPAPTGFKHSETTVLSPLPVAV